MSDSGIFKAAVKLPSDQRDAYLHEVCGDNQALRREVESLLEAHEAPGSFLGRLGAGRELTEDYNPIVERQGTVIGPYKLLQQIGEGGMGAVFMAEQTESVRRKVALKIIKPGMDSAQVIARFEAERQALALMDHPNIAKVFDAGTTPAGRPYFVMELVKGIPLTRFCDENQLTPRERLELFVPVCQAVQHAHQKGVIHRDLKPSNVLVALYDDRPVPKVIDFGVAKATGEKLTERTMFTTFGSLVGTLEYMSPEQAQLNALDVDTRSDVYALGALLYELLTGSTPLERTRLKEAALDELLRLIREEEPPKPSTRLSQSGEALAAISSRRRTEPAKLGKALRGELDWIVMKALEKNRTRRYEAASGLARDLQRYLADEPVEACPPSAGYRLRKLAHKYRKPLAAAAVFALLLLAGAVISAWQAVRAMRAETAARTAHAEAVKERDLALEAEERARVEKANAQAATRFLLAEVLEQADPNHEPNRDLRLRTLVDRAASRLDGDTEMPPRVQAAIRETIGRTYWGLGEYEQAEPLLTQAYALLRQHAGEDHPETLDAALHLARLHLWESDFSKAEPLLLRALDGRLRLFGQDHPETLEAMRNLGLFYNFQDDPQRAEQFLAPALQASFPSSDRDPTKVRLSFALGHVYVSQGRSAEAERLLGESLGGCVKILGEKHPFTLTCRLIVADLYLQTGRLAEAEQQAGTAYRTWREVSGLNPHTLWSQALLAEAYLAQGRRIDAEPLVQEFRLKAERQQGRLSPFNIRMIWELGRALLKQHDFTQAEAFLRLYLAVAEKKLPDGWRRSSARSGLGASLLGQQRCAEAEPLLLKGYEGLKEYTQTIPEAFRPTRLTEALDPLVQLYEVTGRPDEAARCRKQREDLRSATKAASGP
jgi:serine/threonine protein kinase/tetratricopeptide (TPR) repeat protein